MLLGAAIVVQNSSGGSVNDSRYQQSLCKYLNRAGAARLVR
jgi:hypothetical protein